MKGNDPEFLAAARTIREIFPESKGHITDSVGLDPDAFLGAMQIAYYSADYSCCVFRLPTDPDLGLALKGGLHGSDFDVVIRLLTHAGISPRGQVVIIPDAIGRNNWSTEDRPPFICNMQELGLVFSQANCFRGTNDTILVFGSGEAILVDHDDRVHWARSKQNLAWSKESSR